MKARVKFATAVAAVLALLATGLLAAMFVSSSSASTASLSSYPTPPQMTTGSFSMSYSGNTCETAINPTLPACWNCNYAVDLDQVDITVDPPLATSPKANQEAVRLGAGCTGRIGKITVHTSGGDGIKVINGAQNLVVGYGSVTCQTPPAGLDTDQYGIRVWGGKRVTIAGVYVNCQTSNSRMEYFLNQVPAQNTGAPLADRPTSVLLASSCLASGPRNTALIGGSDTAGILSTTLFPFVPGPGHGPTMDIPAFPSGGNQTANNPLSPIPGFANNYPGSQGSCTNANG